MPSDKPSGPAKGIPQAVCPSCKAPNEIGTLMCKRCGEILPSKPNTTKGAKGSEFDATEGSFSPTCMIVPGILILFAVVFLIFVFSGGAKKGTCEYNQVAIFKAVHAYNKAHSGSKMTNLDIDELMKPGKSGKPFLKERPVCPIDPSARYEINSNGVEVSCSRCSKK